MKEDIHKRDAFRIDDDLIIKYRVASMDDVKTINLHVEQQVDAKKEIRHLFNNIDQQVSGIKINLELKYGELSRYLQSLEKKIDIIANAIMGDDQAERDSLQRVNISETGIAFHSKEELQQDTFLKIEITLQPNYYIIPVISRIVKVIQDEEKFLIATQFVHIKSTDQQALARHIMRKQAEILKK